MVLVLFIQQNLVGERYGPTIFRALGHQIIETHTIGLFIYALSHRRCSKQNTNKYALQKVCYFHFFFSIISLSDAKKYIYIYYVFYSFILILKVLDWIIYVHITSTQIQPANLIFGFEYIAKIAQPIDLPNFNLNFFLKPSCYNKYTHKIKFKSFYYSTMLFEFLSNRPLIIRLHVILAIRLVSSDNSSSVQSRLLNFEDSRSTTNFMFDFFFFFFGSFITF